jgi:hypothetical protein
MLARVEWEVAATALGRTSPEDWGHGCVPYEIVNAAEGLGLCLERQKIGDYDLETAVGILNIGSDRGWHVAVLYNGLLFDTDGHVWRPADYLEAYQEHDPWFGMLLAFTATGHGSAK